MQLNPQMGKGGAGMHGTGAGSAAAALAALSGIRISLVTGGAANAKLALADIRPGAHIIAAHNNNSGTLTDITDTISIDDLRAVGTITVSDAEADESVTVRGVKYVAGTDFAIGADDDATAANLARAIHLRESTSPTGAVTASAVENVVTVRAKEEGTAGNAITLAETGSGFTVSGATLSGGAASGGIRSTGATQQVVLYWFPQP